MPRHAPLTLLFPIALLAIASLAGMAERTAQAAPAPPVHQVWCYDVAEQIVLREWPDDCTARKWRIVSDAEAARIRRARIERVRRALKGSPRPFPGLRLAGLGTGFVVSAKGDLLTNNHVIAGCKSVSAAPPEETPVRGKVVAADPVHDLALIAAPLAGRTVAAFRPREDLASASDVAVVGYPLLGMVAIRPIFVQGIVMAGVAPPSRDRYLINVDVRRGNSGGPVVDRTGEVVGIVVAEANTPEIYRKTGLVVRDVGVAIRPSVAIAFLRKNGVEPVIAEPDSRATLDDGALFRATRRMVAQISCWR